MTNPRTALRGEVCGCWLAMTDRRVPSTDHATHLSPPQLALATRASSKPPVAEAVDAARRWYLMAKYSAAGSAPSVGDALPTYASSGLGSG